MSKVILILDMPSCCNNCPCYDGMEDRSYCNRLGKDIGDNILIIDKDCPLKPLPQKNKYDVDKYATVDYENDITLGHYLNKGWNDCIDEILGETEE